MSEDQEIYRRKFLGATAAGLAGLAGCSSERSEPDYTENSATEKTTEPRDCEPYNLGFNLDGSDFLEGGEQEENLSLTFSRWSGEEYEEVDQETIKVGETPFSIQMPVEPGRKYRVSLEEYEDEDSELHYVEFWAQCDDIEITDTSEGSEFGPAGNQYSLGFDF